jgi:hypothetical protein
MIPQFTAEFSLYASRTHYRATSQVRIGEKSTVSPALLEFHPCKPFNQCYHECLRGCLPGDKTCGPDCITKCECPTIEQYPDPAAPGCQIRIKCNCDGTTTRAFICG